MHVEIVYETGRSSVAKYDSDEEALSAIAAHHERAVNGQSGGPAGAPHIPAERIKKVLVYDKHPNDFNEGQTMSAEILASEMTGLVEKYKDDNGVVSIPHLAAAVQELSHPMVASGPHESNFKMQESRELDLSALDKPAGGDNV